MVAPFRFDTPGFPAPYFNGFDFIEMKSWDSQQNRHILSGARYAEFEGFLHGVSLIRRANGFSFLRF